MDLGRPVREFYPIRPVRHGEIRHRPTSVDPTGVRVYLPLGLSRVTWRTGAAGSVSRRAPGHDKGEEPLAPPLAFFPRLYRSEAGCSYRPEAGCSYRPEAGHPKRTHGLLPSVRSQSSAFRYGL